MNKGILAAIRLVLDKIYPERQIILRCRGNVSFVTLSKESQLALSLTSLLLVGWLAYATIGVYWQKGIIVKNNTDIAQMSGDQDRLSADMHSIEKKYQKTVASLENNQNLLNDALRQRNVLEKIRKNLQYELGKTEKQRDLALGKNYALVHDLDLMRNNNIGLRKAKQDLGKYLQFSEKMVNRLTDQRNQAVSTNKEKNKQIAKLEDHLEILEQSRNNLLENIHDRTSDSIAALESVVKLTGLNLDNLLKRVHHKQLAVGGPLLATNNGNAFSGELTLLEERLTRWSAVNALLGRLPITPPVDAYYISSRYGKRKDPFTKRMAFHSGVDLGGVPRSRVYATSPGVVTFVGRKGPYGRMVEIDHGLGIRTRYGHLQKILVKYKEKVAFRDKIGRMGSSGRSTGAHVHYEVLFDGKPVDPMKFLKAGIYVFKG